MSTEQPPRGRLTRLFEAADRRHVPLRTILVTALVAVAIYLAGKLIYRLPLVNGITHLANRLPSYIASAQHGR
jgi:hypothetical protein